MSEMNWSNGIAFSLYANTVLRDKEKSENKFTAARLANIPAEMMTVKRHCNNNVHSVRVLAFFVMNPILFALVQYSYLLFIHRIMLG